VGEVETRSGEGEGDRVAPNHFLLLQTGSTPTDHLTLGVSRIDLSRAAGEVR